MKLRTALKILNKPCPSNYWKVLYNPKTDKYCGIPHSGKHWHLILKAIIKLGKTGKEAITAYKDSIEAMMSDNDENFNSAIDFDKTKIIYEL